MPARRPKQLHTMPSSSEPPAEEASTARNKSIPSKAQVRGVRGKLQSMSELPLDIVLEIFGQLQPMDLLNLSRTSKPLRSMLMRRSSQSIWKRSRASIDGLPECPNDMSEPAYANLVFYPYCNFCSKAYVNSKGILWMMRARVCKKCIPIHFQRLPWGARAQRNSLPVCTLPYDTGRYKDFYVHKDTLHQYNAEKQDLTGTALDEWLALKSSQCFALREHAERCEKWNEGRSLQRTNELDNLRDQRYQAIKEKLSDLGWVEEIVHLENFHVYGDLPLSEHKLVKQPKVLTDRIWNNIKDTLIQFMEDCKVRRLERLRTTTIRKRGAVLFEVLRTYGASQPLHTILPPMADIAVLPAFRTIIEDTPLDEEVAALHFQSCMADFPQIVVNWRSTKDEILVKLINDHPGEERATVTTLQRATTFFHCQLCKHSISYPRILVHACRDGLPINFDHLNIEPYFKALQVYNWYRGDRIQYDPLAFERATRILQDSQLDPAMTADSLKKLDIRFECRTCSTSDDCRTIMKWPSVVEHLSALHSSTSGTVIQRAVLTHSERRLVENLEIVKEFVAVKVNGDILSWICRECNSRLSWERSYRHLLEQHSEIVAGDYTLDEHENKPERYMAFHLDADASLFETPVQLFAGSLVRAFRNAFVSGNELWFRDKEEQVDHCCQRLAERFTALLAI